MTINHHRIFNSNPENLPIIEEFILNITENLNLSETIQNNIELVVAEAAANCILHGNKNDASKKVDVNITKKPKKLVITFQDEGEGFDPDKVPDPTVPENILKGSGRGLHIMRSLVDKLEYKFLKGGTRIIITFNI